MCTSGDFLAIRALAYSLHATKNQGCPNCDEQTRKLHTYLHSSVQLSSELRGQLETLRVHLQPLDTQIFHDVCASNHNSNDNTTAMVTSTTAALLLEPFISTTLSVVYVTPYALITRPLDVVWLQQAYITSTTAPTTPAGSDDNIHVLVHPSLFLRLLTFFNHVDTTGISSVRELPDPTQCGRIDTPPSLSPIVVFPEHSLPWHYFRRSVRIQFDDAYLDHVLAWRHMDEDARGYCARNGASVPDLVQWFNRKNIRDTCTPQLFTRASTQRSCISVVISTFSERREKLLLELVQEYLKMGVVGQVVVIWNEPLDRNESLARYSRIQELYANEKRVLLMPQKVREYFVVIGINTLKYIKFIFPH